MLKSVLKNGEPWYDEQGNVIHSHGGFIIKFKGIYYWYGECREDNKFVNCYSSEDLHNWKYENTVLDTNSRCDLFDYSEKFLLTNNGVKCNLERPKVIYNEKTGKFVMWIHYENGLNYECAMCAVASCDTPNGNFVFHGAFRPLGFMSRDLTVYCDGNGKSYMLSASNDNADLHIYELTEDSLNIKRLCSKQFIGLYREAPAVFKKGNKYYMLSSYCTSWAPNQGKVSFSDNIEDGWSSLYNFGDKTTYRSQPAFVLPLENENGTVDYYYFGDRWGGSDWKSEKEFVYSKSTVVCWKIGFSGEIPELEAVDEF